MGELKGFEEYLNENYEKSIFNHVLQTNQLWDFYVHGNQKIRATILEKSDYEVKLKNKDQEEHVISKIEIKYICPVHASGSVKPLIKTDNKVKNQKLAPLEKIRQRNWIKNKSLFPLMREREVVFITLLEGEIIRGLVADFSKYDLTISLKGGILVYILRHSIIDVRDKKNRCYLKSIQEKAQYWKKSSIYETLVI